MANRRKKNARPRQVKRPKKPSCGARVRLMKQNFMVHHKAGYTVRDIARMYELGESTVYDALDEIAAANNVSRESLLWKVKPAVSSVSGVIVHEGEKETEVQGESHPLVSNETMNADTLNLATEEVVTEYEENQQVLNGLLEVVTQLEDTLTQVLEEEKRYA